MTFEVETMPQEDLANIFARQMTFDNQSAIREEKAKADQPITYISQHYHHSAHLVNKTATNSDNTELSAEQLHTLFRTYDIEPTCLIPSQIELYKKADSNQKLRLLEIWRTSPPDYDMAVEAGSWPETNLEQEEALAELRYERMLVARQQAPARHNVPSDSAATIHSSMVLGFRAESLDGQSTAEPYLISFYGEPQRVSEQKGHMLQESSRVNRAMDPVYRGPGLWQKAAAEDMENRYGTYRAVLDIELSSNEHGGVAEIDDEMIL